MTAAGDYASMSDVRFALLGFGDWAQHHARFIQKTQGAVLVAVVDIDASRRELAAREFGVRTYDDFRSLLAEEMVEIVDVTLPNFLHYDAALAALEHGRSLLLEKPMAVTTEQCDVLLERQQQVQAGGHRPLLAIGFELRCSSLWGRVRELVASGEVGEVGSVEFNIFRAAPAAGLGGWRLDTVKAGSWMLEAPIHYFDLLRWFMSERGEPQSIYSVARPSSSGKALVDSFASIMRFSGESYGLLSYSMAGYGYAVSAKVIGTAGALWAHWEDRQPDGEAPVYWLEIGCDQKRRRITIERPAGELDDLCAEIEQVVRAIQTGAPLHATGQDGRAAVSLSLAAEQSIRTGTVVSLTER